MTKMKRLWIAILLCSGLAGAADVADGPSAGNPSNDKAIPTCFKVRRLLKTDETH